MEQQSLLQAAEERIATPAPSPKFQLLNGAEKVGYKPLPVNTNTGIFLGAQLGQLTLNPGKTLTRVDMLHANQQQMHQHQMELLRKQQLEAAEAKVESFLTSGLSLCKIVS